MKIARKKLAIALSAVVTAISISAANASTGPTYNNHITGSQVAKVVSGVSLAYAVAAYAAGGAAVAAGAPFVAAAAVVVGLWAWFGHK